MHLPPINCQDNDCEGLEIVLVMERRLKQPFKLLKRIQPYQTSSKLKKNTQRNLSLSQLCCDSVLGERLCYVKCEVSTSDKPVQPIHVKNSAVKTSPLLECLL